MNESLFERVRLIAADILQLAPKRITQHSSTENIDTWDSLHHLNLILALEQEFDLQFEPDEMERMTSIQEIMAILAKKEAIVH